MNGCIDPNFWNGKRVFLTGHTGFKGSWMSLWLHDLGAKVYGFSLPPNSTPALYNLLELDEFIESTIGDIRDPKPFLEAFTKASPDIVIHMAAQPIVSSGYEDPVGTFDTNIMGTVHLLEMCRGLKAGLPILVISSDKCYLNNNAGRDFEIDDPLGGHDPYSASKAGTEIVVGSYQSSFFSGAESPALASARAGNVIGGGDWSENRLFPDGAKAFSEGRSFLLRNPSATRPWQHVLEPLYGYMVLIQAIVGNRDFAGPWNFGPLRENNQPVGKIAQIFSDAWGGNASVEIASEQQTWQEAKTLGLNCTLTNERLNWKPALDMPTTIAWTGDWYREVYADMSTENVRSITRQQIEKYVKSQDQHS